MWLTEYITISRSAGEQMCGCKYRAIVPRDWPGVFANIILSGTMPCARAQCIDAPLIMMQFRVSRALRILRLHGRRRLRGAEKVGINGIYVYTGVHEIVIDEMCVYNVCVMSLYLMQLSIGYRICIAF